MFMEDITLLVSRNLKRIREERKLSLDKLAELTGVSKSMLAQIERGESSPTIAVVWKIASGLKMSFTSLLSVPQTDTHIVHKSTIQPMLADDGRYRLYPIFPIEDSRRFEVYLIEMDPGSSLSAEAHSDGTSEFITIFEGELCIVVNDQEYWLVAGDSIQFRADRPHVYLNARITMVKAHMVIQYPQ
jgi:XRE family transcriptional regulator, regulator of sulfur utilization